MSRKHAPARRRLCIEALEDRCLLSAGDLDPTFGSGGLVTTNLGTQNSSYAYDLAVYHNEGATNEGKIVAAGTVLVSSRDQDLGIVRYNLDGSLDKSFGGSGQVTTSLGTGNDGAHDVKIQSDGKVVVAGWTGGSGSDFAVLRYNADGSLDTSFGGRGKAITDINRSGDFAWTMGLQSDGKIVLAGVTTPKNTSNVDLAVVRYNADGSLDTTFGMGGKVTRHFASPLSATVNGGMGMAIDSSTNKVVIVAQFTQGPDVVLRLNTNGSPDTSFGSNGAGYVSISTPSTDPAVAIQTDGRIVVTGGNGYIELARFNPDGTLDATFGSGGTVVTALPATNEFARAVTIQADGKIVVAGVQDNASGAGQFMVARYNPDGSQDTTFGVNGIADETVVRSRNDQMAVALEPDGRIVVAGPGVIGGGTNFALVRFLGDSPPVIAQAAIASPAAGNGLTQPDAPTQARASAAYGQLPLSFEANKGQTDSRVNFLSRGSGYALFLTSTRAVLSLKHGDTSNVVGMRVIGASPASRAVGLDKQAGVSNYLIGSDPSKWHTGVPNYGEVDYQNAYRGIDLVYHGDQGQLEYDFVVKPGANPRAIRLAFDGTQGKTLDALGNLVLHTSGGDVVEHAPVVYQEVNGQRQAVAGRYVLEGHHEVGFQVGRYDHSKPLVIDPTLSYSTYLGGRANDRGTAIAVDSFGNAYITGYTISSNFPTKGPVQRSSAGGADVFVTKLDPTGTALVYSTYLGGSNSDIGNAIAVDSVGNAYVAGSTTSANFPTTSPLQAHLKGSEDAFLLKLNPAGTALVYSTYLGGGGLDVAYGIAVGSSGNAYVTGTTGSTDFPTTPGAYQTANPAITVAFVAEVNATGSGLVYATYLGGSAGGRGLGIAVDGSGNAYVTGVTASTNFATAGAYQTVNAGGNDAFVAKLNADGSARVYATYLGGSGEDSGLGIAVDGSGNAYVTGVTTSTNFPTLNAYQPVYGGNGDAFVTKFNATGTALLYSTYLGGNDQDNTYDNGGAIAVDAAGNIYLTGFTLSTNFPTLNAFQPTSGGSGDAFVAKINPAQSGTASLVYSSYLGGSAGGGDEGYGIAVDGFGNAYLTGETASTDFPITTNAFQTKFGGAKHTSDAFVTKISAN